MQIGLVYSTIDPVGVMVAKIIEKKKPTWLKMYSFDEDLLNIHLDKVKEENIVFVSRHESSSKIKALTVHSVGNFGKAIFGGKDNKLCNSLPIVCGNYLRSMNKKSIEKNLASQGFRVSLEATHHGPYTEKNCLFIEIGSSEEDWKNKVAGKVIAETIIEETLKKSKDKICIGIGGNHYASEFTKLTINKNYSFGHICAKYSLEYLDENLLEQMIVKSKASDIVLDWTGLKQKERILELCKKTGLKIYKSSELLKN